MHILHNAIDSVLRRFGYEHVRLRPNAIPRDVDEVFASLFERVRHFTLTSPERVFALREAIAYIARHQIEGDIVECGVWRGGSMMAAAMTLLSLGDVTRSLYLFDTFTGMSVPDDADVDLDGRKAETYGNFAVPLEGVQAAMHSTGYPADRIRFVVGRVEDTIPTNAPERISLLRLDTDWYKSTRHELVHLWPRLTVGGVLIVDDYGHWRGARVAVDEFFGARRSKVLLHRIDYTCRVIVKIES